MKIAVTGSSGRLGRQVMQNLTAAGHQVLGIDRIADSAMQPSWVCDLTRTGDLFEAFADREAVVHLAAVSAPNLMPDSVTFNNNVAALYNVLKVAAALGIGRIVIASSIAAFGFLYARKMPEPDYLPLDEEHPCQPTDCYGLSKRVGEMIADSFAAQTDASISSLRLPGVNFDPQFKLIKERFGDPQYRLPGFWTYIDARDAAEACRLALERAPRGHAIFNVAAPTSNMPVPTDALLERYLPSVKKKQDTLKGNWSGMDSGKAERILGFRAQHVWERYVQSPA